MSSNRFDNMRNKYMIPSNESNQTTTDPVTVTQQDREPNILDQISAYNSNQTEVFIKQVNDELTEQKQINNILKTTDYETNTKEIKDFVSNHKDDISSQLTRMENVFLDLKTLYEENQQLHSTQDNYNNTIGSDNVNQVASELRRLKTLKSDILTFLYSTGIRAPTN